MFNKDLKARIAELETENRDLRRQLDNKTAEVNRAQGAAAGMIGNVNRLAELLDAMLVAQQAQVEATDKGFDKVVHTLGGVVNALERFARSKR